MQERHEVKIIVSDSGSHSHSVTATLFVTVADVNDNPPHIASLSLIENDYLHHINMENNAREQVSRQSQIRIRENSSPRKLATFSLDDPDEWQLGHGPPFLVQLNPNASVDIKTKFSVEYESSKFNGIMYSLSHMSFLTQIP